MSDDTYDDPFEPATCENCVDTGTDRVCSRCGRRICRICATQHRMGPIVYQDLPEEDQPPWCRALTPAEQRVLDRLPMGVEEAEREVRRRNVYRKLVADGLARWTTDKMLVRTAR